jgi:hypothetical protein
VRALADLTARGSGRWPAISVAPRRPGELPGRGSAAKRFEKLEIPRCEGRDAVEAELGEIQPIDEDIDRPHRIVRFRRDGHGIAGDSAKTLGRRYARRSAPKFRILKIYRAETGAEIRRLWCETSDIPRRIPGPSPLTLGNVHTTPNTGNGRRETIVDSNRDVSNSRPFQNQLHRRP